jgi:hypothetical protein
MVGRGNFGIFHLTIIGVTVILIFDRKFPGKFVGDG